MQTKNVKTWQRTGTVIAALLVGVLLSPMGAAAQSEELRQALDEVNQNVEALTAPEPTDDAPVMIQLQAEDDPELQQRRQALVSVIDFSLVEVEDVLNKLDVALRSTEDREARKSYQDLAKMLRTRRAYLQSLKQIVSDPVVTLEDVKTSAAELKLWRDLVYNPEVKLAVDIPLIVQAESVLTTAGERFTKISSDVIKIERRLSSQPLTPFLKEANLSLEKASWYHSRARSAAVEAVSKRQTLLTTVVSEVDPELEPATTTPQAVEQVSIPLVPSLEPATYLPAASEELAIQAKEIEVAHKAIQLYTQQVSEQVKATYQTFLKMSAKAKELLNR